MSDVMVEITWTDGDITEGLLETGPDESGALPSLERVTQEISSMLAGTTCWLAFYDPVSGTGPSYVVCLPDRIRSVRIWEKA